MKITQSRIQKIGNYLVGLDAIDDFYIALTDLSNLNRIRTAGFAPPLNVGSQILPAIVGRISRLNANGGYTIHRNLPKETAYRQADIKDWHGRYHTIDIPYQRYPRTPIPAPNVELVIAAGANGQTIIRSPQLTKGVTPDEEIIHVINLFLELFGECDTIRTNLVPVFNVPVIRLNWSILPNGNYPWAVLRTNVQQAIGNVRTSRRHMIDRRLETISNHNPNFVAVGNAGFRGYIVFGFPNQDFFILESIHTGNATYIFDDDWPQLSQLTKEQIISQNLQQNRFVHNEEWDNQVNGLF